MRQIWLPPELIKGEDFCITGDSHHHLSAVMRVKTGEEFEAISGLGYALKLKVLSSNKKETRVVIEERRMLTALPKPYLGLAFCMPKFPIFEEVLEKMVELGVSAVQPLISERSFIRSAKDVSLERHERWRKIVQSASAQCQRAELMQLSAPIELETFTKQINQKSGSACLMAYEGSHAPLRPQVQKLQTGKPEWVWIVIGPEGGLSEVEAAKVQALGIPDVSLGGLIMRTETACFTLFSVLKYELGILQ